MDLQNEFLDSDFVDLVSDISVSETDVQIEFTDSDSNVEGKEKLGGGGPIFDPDGDLHDEFTDAYFDEEELEFGQLFPAIMIKTQPYGIRDEEAANAVAKRSGFLTARDHRVAQHERLRIQYIVVLFFPNIELLWHIFNRAKGYNTFETKDSSKYLSDVKRKCRIFNRAKGYTFETKDRSKYLSDVKRKCRQCFDKMRPPVDEKRLDSMMIFCPRGFRILETPAGGAMLYEPSQTENETPVQVFLNIATSHKYGDDDTVDFIPPLDSTSEYSYRLEHLRGIEKDMIRLGCRNCFSWRSRECVCVLRPNFCFMPVIETRPDSQYLAYLFLNHDIYELCGEYTGSTRLLEMYETDYDEELGEIIPSEATVTGRDWRKLLCNTGAFSKKRRRQKKSSEQGGLKKG